MSMKLMMMQMMLLMMRRFEVEYYFGELKKKGWKSQPSSHLIPRLKLLLKIPIDILAEQKTFCLSPASPWKLF